MLFSVPFRLTLNIYVISFTLQINIEWLCCFPHPADQQEHTATLSPSPFRPTKSVMLFPSPFRLTRIGMFFPLSFRLTYTIYVISLTRGELFHFQMNGVTSVLVSILPSIW